MTIIRLVGGLSPGVGSDPRTFPAIFNAAADLVEENEAGLSVVEGGVSALEGKNIPDFSVTAPSDEQVLRFDATLGVFVPEDLPNTGGLVAVKSAIRSTIFDASVTAGGNVAVPGLSITHEVADPANRLIISAFFGAAATSGGRGSVGIAVNDGSGLIAVGASPGNRNAVTAGGATETTVSNFVVTMPSVTFVHTPGAGSKTYTVRAINIRAVAGTLFINRAEVEPDDGFFSRAVSSLVIQEVAV